MACPYFYPTTPLALGYWGKRARLPLGDLFAGVCHADPLEPFDPDEDRLRECCNLGYARGCCPRFPDGPGPDAVRFVVSADENGSLRIAFAVEHDYRPGECGALDFDRARQALASPPLNPLLARQAEAYASSYLRRKPARQAAAAGDGR